MIAEYYLEQEIAVTLEYQKLRHVYAPLVKHRTQSH